MKTFLLRPGAHITLQTGSDSDAMLRSALVRVQTRSNWTDKKLQDLEDEMRYEFEKLQMMQQTSDMRVQSGSVSSQAAMGSGVGGGGGSGGSGSGGGPQGGAMPIMAPTSELADMQSKMQAMLDEQKAHLAAGGSGTSQADNDTTDWQDETEYSDDDEMAQMRAKMKEMVQNNSNAFGSGM